MMAAAMAHHTRHLSMCVNMALTLYECSNCPATTERYTTLSFLEAHKALLHGMHDQLQVMNEWLSLAKYLV